MNLTGFPRRVLVGSLLLAGASTSFAQVPGVPEPGADPNEIGLHPPINLMLDYSSTASGTTEFHGRDRAESDAQSATIIIEGAVPLGAPPNFEEGIPSSPPKWMMPLGVLSQNIAFDEVPGVPVPGSVHTVSLNTGLGYRMNEEWMFMARVSPTLYRTESITEDDIGVSGGLMALWCRNPELTWMFGVMVDPDGEFSVLPVVGANWIINPEFTLSLMVPRPRIIYRPDQRWSCHAGASLNGATFLTSDTFGTERDEPRYNHALASYRDIRLGAGFELRVNRRLSLQAEGGYSVGRQIEYTRIDERVEFGSAPYFQLGLRATF